MPRQPKPKPLPKKLYARRYHYSLDDMHVGLKPEAVSQSDETVEVGIYQLIGTVTVANKTTVTANTPAKRKKAAK